MYVVQHWNFMEYINIILINIIINHTFEKAIIYSVTKRKLSREFPYSNKLRDASTKVICLPL